MMTPSGILQRSRVAHQLSLSLGHPDHLSLIIGAQLKAVGRSLSAIR